MLRVRWLDGLVLVRFRCCRLLQERGFRIANEFFGQGRIVLGRFGWLLITAVAILPTWLRTMLLTALLLTRLIPAGRSVVGNR
jgi:hypothetical protein